MNYIISGSRGLIGEQLKKRLDSRGDKCVLEIDQRLGSNVLSLGSYQLTPSTQQTDMFLHLAAFCKIAETIKHPKLAHTNNANGVFEALEFCRKNNIPKFVYMSSSRTLSPEENPYTASKKYGENLCEAYKQCYGLEYLIIRPSTVYGGKFDITTRLITKWIQNALDEKPLILNGDKNKTLDFTHVDDFVDGVMCLFNNWDKAKNQAYDISGNDIRKLIDVYNLIIEKTKSKSPLILKSAEIAQPQQIAINIDRIKSFGYNPKIKLEEGLDETLEWYKNNKEIWRQWN